MLIRWCPGNRRLFILAACVLVFRTGASADDSTIQTVENEATTTVARHALLVGCTKYPSAPRIPELWGPANDVPAFADLLTSRFGFPPDNIRRLVGWTDDPASRPTYKNIVSAFEDLIEKSGPGSQIVVLMTGHGTQTPVPESQRLALDPANPEHDGLDEVFLPADFEGWTETGMKNAILDDQMGEWLDRMKNRGASVWIIFDCCHSGTMTRDANLVERHRGVSPQIIGVPDVALEAAAAKSSAAAERPRRIITAETDLLDSAARNSSTPAAGNVTAFYAAQAFETAPELPRPSDAPRTPEHYFGLLTYMLIQAFESQDDAITFRDLGRRVISRYRAERGSRSPTPFFHGDLDHEVLGLSVFPERSSMILEQIGDTTRVSAGELMGLTPGTVLAVYAPDDRIQNADSILGYVRVRTVTHGSSEVEDMSCLNAIDRSDKLPLLFGLLQREMAARQNHGKPVTRKELDTRFPDNRELVDALFDHDLSAKEIAPHLPEYECLEHIPGGPIGGIYKLRHRSTGELRVVRRISAFFADQAGLAHSRDSADVMHFFHPNITAPVELIEHDGVIFVITEYFCEMNLAELVERRHPIPVAVICEISLQVAYGLAHIHTFFKAHGDIRPANILIATEGPQTGQVRIGGVAGGLVNERQACYALWPPGVFHTPTFYAPEVLAGRDPDTRSDVYGLGQTIAMALAGNQSAAVVAPPSRSTSTSPRLCELRPDCPSALESLILQMTAHDPDERFDSAREVLTAIQSHADAMQFQAWLSDSGQNVAASADEQAADMPVRNSRKPATSAHSADLRPARRIDINHVAAGSESVHFDRTDNKLMRPMPEQTAAIADADSGKLTKFRLKTVVGIIAVAIVALIAWPNRHLLLGPSGQQKAPDWVATYTELPGPNGDWWFEEIPWFTPLVRSELAALLIAEDSRIDSDEVKRLAERLQSYPDYESVNELKDLALRVISFLPVDRTLIVRQIMEINPGAHTVGELKEEYSSLAAELDPQELSSAADWHLRATLLQACSESNEAGAAYERALELYAGNPDGQSAGLRALCAADYARLLASFDRNYKKANVYFRLSAENASTTALDVMSMCRMADALRKWGRRDEAVKTLIEAQRMIQAESEILSEHPLYAVVHETLGWAAFDTWQLAEATSEFNAAREIRLSHRKAGNPRSWRSILWIEQGQAMTAHFQGDQQRSQEKYRALLEQIDSALKGGFVRELPKQQRTELAARRPNLYERLADCYLFGAGIDHVEACKALNQALQATEDSSFDSERLWPHILALRYKYALALTLAGEQDLSVEAFESADTERLRRQQDSQISEGSTTIYQPVRMVALSVRHIEDGSPDERQEAVRALEEFYSTASAQVTRTNIDLVMLVSEALLKPAVLQPERARRVVRRLNSVIDGIRAADDERLTSVYLQRYCENAQRALQIAPANSLTAESNKMGEQLALVLAESKDQSVQVGRGLTRGTIQYDDDGKPVSCRLHVLTIGVSEYQHHPELQLGYADDDADALFAAWEALSNGTVTSHEGGTLFKRGHFQKLKDEVATKSAIIEAIDNIAQIATENDLVVVSLSGHGTVDEDGNFFFLPCDYRDQSLRATAIWDQELRAMLTRRKSNAILVLDACHSGAVTTIASRSATTQELRNAMHRFASSQKGLIVLAASLSNQKALEDQDFGHGVLTLALLEALTGRYDKRAVEKLKSENITPPQLPKAHDSSGLITLADIQYYIELRVMGLSDRKQSATMNRMGGDLSLRDIPIRIEAVAKEL